MLIGIDFGSKLAGTTVVAYETGNKIELIQSKKNQDADVMLIDFISSYFPNLVFIDAPLSVPSGIIGNGSDFFFRPADRELNAMSPMFLGGLTARAMKLKYHFASNKSIQFFETYPKHCATLLGLQFYDKKNKITEQAIQELQQNILAEVNISNWHQFDAVLCLISAIRFNNETGQIYGNQEDGHIYV